MENEANIESFALIDVIYLSEVYCNKDWYVITYSDGTIEKFIYSNDDRAKEEFNGVLKSNEKKLKKVPNM